MNNIISVFSFRRGRGKTDLVTNIASLLAFEGRRVCVVDANFQSPGVYIRFGIEENIITNTLNDYLKGMCSIDQATMDTTANLGAAATGRLWLVSASPKTTDIMDMLHREINFETFNVGLERIAEKLQTDVIFIDTQSGINDLSLISMAISRNVLVLLHLDQQDYQGTALMLDLAHKLEVPQISIIVNQVLETYKIDEIKQQVRQTYHCEAAAVIPYSDDMMVESGTHVFSLGAPKHKISNLLRTLAHQLMA